MTTSSTATSPAAALTHPPDHRNVAPTGRNPRKGLGNSAAKEIRLLIEGSGVDDADGLLGVVNHAAPAGRVPFVGGNHENGVQAGADFNVAG